MKPRSFFSILAVAVIVLLSIAGGSFYWILAQSPLSLLAGGVTKEPAAAILVPRQAPVMVSLLVNPSELEIFSQLSASPANRRESRSEILEVERSLLAKTGLNYQKEIQPWLGDEITLAVTSLDFDRNPDNGVQPGYLLAVKTKDAQLAKEFLQLSYSQRALSPLGDLVFEQYKGVNIIYQRLLSSGQNPVTLNASAVVGDFVIFANAPKVLKDALNNIQVPLENLKGASYYQEALKTIVEPRIGIVYANLPAFSAWIAKVPFLETPEVTQTLTVALSLKSQGLVAQTALIGVSGEDNREAILSQPVAALQYVPENSIFAAAGTNLNQFWNQVQTGLAPNSPLQVLLTQLITRVQTPLGLNLPQDIFAWVQGEYTLALMPNSDGGEPDWLFIAQKVPGLNQEQAIAHLDELAQEQGYSVGNLPLLDTTMTAWTKLTTASKNQGGKLARLDAQVRGVHTTTDNYYIFATSIETLSRSLAATETSLKNSDKFQRAIAAIPEENEGYFYLDWHQIQPLIEEKIPLVRVIELAGKPLFKNLRSLTLSSQGSEKGIRRATVFFNLGVRANSP